ncbi:hypothetical protein A3J23_02925 [Candidatus Peregrinibacteria bacterium RIFCSPLOWO2_02_FULL_48_14]|nr:MAG: hypothetical protein A3J23_02925 [Candidatus Peregrinibacteria bacterium RIFCSPLOWO2_02_FULL_48_14]
MLGDFRVCFQKSQRIYWSLLLIPKIWWSQQYEMKLSRRAIQATTKMIQLTQSRENSGAQGPSHQNAKRKRKIRSSCPRLCFITMGGEAIKAIGAYCTLSLG